MSFWDLDLLQQYVAIAIGLYGILMICLIIGLVRLTIMYATKEFPNPEHISVLPSFTFVTFVSDDFRMEKPYGWFGQATGNTMIYLFGGAIGCFIWILSPLYFIHKLVESSRKKRFGT